ncbi:hypothetical protein FOYG_02324 [Fusarium oxysporum NRRL 32931]|uniref:NACHT domain-containing protein n=1 Tax=Fusarium oxysporum NRRL 32931 TaxID=660029 RepID=W9IXV1_FUSOX|nr:hypothetical protein FOYG_02324 [Fusarium oxysporum NRRL 32931]
MSTSSMFSPVVSAGHRFLDSLEDNNRSIATLCTSADTFIHHVKELDAVQNAQSGVKKSIFNSISTFSENVEPYVKVIDTFVSSKPEVAALIWGAARLVLQLASNYLNFFRKLTGMMEKTSSQLANYKQLLELLEENDIKPTPGLQCAVVTTYEGILDFFQKLVDVFYKKTGKAKSQPIVIGNILLKPLDSTFNTLQEKLSDCDTLVDKELQLYQLRLILQRRQEDVNELEANNDQSSDALRQLIAAIDALVKSVKVEKKGEERHIDAVRNDIRQWINPPEFMRRYESIIDEIEETTTEWLFQKDQYKKWESFDGGDKEISQGKVLWIHGKPGSGKSFLSASAIDLLNASARSNKHTVVLFFHFNADDPTSNTITAAYRSILAQLFQKYSDSRSMIDRFSFSLADSHGQKTASMFEVVDLLDLCLRNFEGRCFIILDGIDECSDNGRSLSTLLTTISHCPFAKLLLFSRPTVAFLNEWVPPHERFPIGDENSSDIQQYLKRRIESFVERDYLPASVQKERLLHHLTLGADGMFLWAHLMIKYLDTDAMDQESRVSAIFDITMPDDLDRMYFRILQRIQLSNSIEREWAAKVFSCLTYAFTPGPFRPEELRLFLSPNAKKHLPLARFVQTTVRVCGALVELGSDGQIRFIHISVKVYFISQAAGFGHPPHRAHAMCAAVYLEYMVTHLPSEPLPAGLHNHLTLLDTFPLVKVAIGNWMHHCVNALLAMKNDPSDRKDEGSTNIEIIRDLVDILIPRLHQFLDNQFCFLSWIEMSYRLSVSVTKSCLVWKASLKELSSNLTNHSCGVYSDSVSRTLTDLIDLVSRTEDIETEWNSQLLQDPAIVWREVEAFHRHAEHSPAAPVMKVTSLCAEKPGTLEAENGSLKTISRIRNDGKAIIVLSIWPSRAFEDAAFRSAAELSGKNLWNACSGWVAKLEAWTTEEQPTRAISLVIKINAQEVLIQCKQSAWEDRNKSPASPWSLQFPLAISSSGRYFCILRTVYEVSQPESQHCQPKLRKFKLNLNLDGRDDWDPYRHVEHNLLEPWFLYFPSFTASDDLFVLYSKVGTPLVFALFQTKLGDKFQLTLKSSDMSEIVLKPDDFHSIMICDNPALPLVGFIAGPGAYLWDWTHAEQPRILCCYSSDVDEPVKIAFSSCGKFFILRLQANPKPMTVDTEQVLGIKRMPELQQRSNPVTSESFNIMTRKVYGSFLQRSKQYGVIDSTDASMVIKDGVPATDALHVVSSQNQFVVRNIREDQEADGETVNEVQLTRLPESVANSSSAPNATIIVPDGADRMVKIAVTDEPSLYSRLSPGRNQLLMLIQREKTSLQFQTTKISLPVRNSVQNVAIQSQESPYLLDSTVHPFVVVPWRVDEQLGMHVP